MNKKRGKSVDFVKKPSSNIFNVDQKIYIKKREIPALIKIQDSDMEHKYGKVSFISLTYLIS